MTISLPLIHTHTYTAVSKAKAVSIFINYCGHYVCGVELITLLSCIDYCII